jgi:hypothetical protein
MSVMHFVPQLKNSATYPARREQSVTLLSSVRLLVEGQA